MCEKCRMGLMQHLRWITYNAAFQAIGKTRLWPHLTWLW